MKRSALSLLTVAAFAAAAPVATADTPTRVGVDQKHGVSFRVTGPKLVVTLRPIDGQPNPLAKELSGKKASLGCSGRSPLTGKLAFAYDDFKWPKGATSYTGTLSVDVSDGLKWCVLERPDPPRKDYAATKKLRVPNPAAPAPAE